MEKSIRTFAPATVANVSCGFDVLGFAVEQPGDEILLKTKPAPGIRISEITGDNGKLSYDPSLNTAGVAIQGLLDFLDSSQGFDITLHKKMPFSSGMGSSAASAVAGVFAANALLDSPLSKRELLPFAIEAERIACGSPIADNVAAALLGGFVLIREFDPLDIVSIDTPADLFCTLLHPEIEIKTLDARNILRKEISLKNAIRQWGNVGGLIAGLMKSDYGLISRSMKDVIIEPIRSLLIPGFDEATKAARDAGALGAGISGSGPSIFALSKGQETAEKVSREMKNIYDNLKIESTVFVSGINRQGPVVLS